jgi:hypothetical protein
VECGGV